MSDQTELSRTVSAPASHDPSRGPRAATLWALGVLGVTTLLALLCRGGSTPAGPYFGTRIGMSERAVRERFEDAPFGAWTSTEEQGQVALRWTRKADRPGAPVAVVFELNENKVVALRADLDVGDPLALGPTVESSFAAVIARQPEASGRVRLTVLSRGCSKHFAESARLIASAPPDTLPNL